MHPEPCSSPHGCAHSTYSHSLHVCTHTEPHVPPHRPPHPQETNTLISSSLQVFVCWLCVALSSQWSMALAQPASLPITRARVPHAYRHGPEGEESIPQPWQGLEEEGFSASSLDGEKICAKRQELPWHTGSKPGHPSSLRHITLACHGATRQWLVLPTLTSLEAVVAGRRSLSPPRAEVLPLPEAVCPYHRAAAELL